MSHLTKKRVTFYNPLGGTIQTLSSNFETIPAEGKTILKQLADFIEAKASNKEKAELVFICTHNRAEAIFHKYGTKLRLRTIELKTF